MMKEKLDFLLYEVYLNVANKVYYIPLLSHSSINKVRTKRHNFRHDAICCQRLCRGVLRKDTQKNITTLTRSNTKEDVHDGILNGIFYLL